MKLIQISSWKKLEVMNNELQNKIIKSWLLEDGPITERIKLKNKFKLKLLKDEVSDIDNSDKDFLGNISGYIRVREVILMANNVPIVFSVGFVFQSRKYSDGSSNLRIQFTYGRGRQYAKNTGLRIFRKHWISSKGVVSIKHPEHVKINTILQQLKQRIDNAKKSFDNEDSNFEDIYKLILNNS